MKEPNIYTYKEGIGGGFDVDRKRKNQALEGSKQHGIK